MKVELTDGDVELLYNLLSDIIYSNFHATITFELDKYKKQIVEIRNLMSYHRILIKGSKKELVEQGLKEFSINPKFRKLLNWLCEEFDKKYERKMDEMFDAMENSPRIPSKNVRKVKLKIRRKII